MHHCELVVRNPKDSSHWIHRPIFLPEIPRAGEKLVITLIQDDEEKDIDLCIFAVEHIFDTRTKIFYTRLDCSGTSLDFQILEKVSKPL